MVFLFTKLFRNIVLLVVAFNLIGYYLRWKNYNILAKDFKTIAAAAASNNALSAISKFQSDLKRTYKGHTLIGDSSWNPLSMGGLQLRLQLIYATPFEALTFMAAASPTVGRSGLHWANSTCTVLTGECIRHSDSFSNLVKETFTSGQNFRQGQFESYVYELKEGTHLVCYSRGFIPASAVPALSGSLAAGDPLGAAKLIYTYTKVSFENMAATFLELFHHYKTKVTKFEL